MFILSSFCLLFISICDHIIICFFIVRHQIVSNWGKNKCKPYITPIAGFFGKDAEKTAKECIGLSLDSSAYAYASPFSDAMSSMTNSMTGMIDGLSAAGDLTSILSGSISGGLEAVVQTIIIIFTKI